MEYTAEIFRVEEQNSPLELRIYCKNVTPNPLPHKGALSQLIDFTVPAKVINLTRFLVGTKVKITINPIE